VASWITFSRPIAHPQQSPSALRITPSTGSHLTVKIFSHGEISNNSRRETVNFLAGIFKILQGSFYFLQGISDEADDPAVRLGMAGGRTGRDVSTNRGLGGGEFAAQGNARHPDDAVRRSHQRSAGGLAL
jgi:hypothetical protein